MGIGALIVAASSLATAGAPSYAALAAFRGAGGFGSALFFTALLTLVVRSVPPQRRGRAVGTLQEALLFGIAFGPSVGGVLAEPQRPGTPGLQLAGRCAGLRLGFRSQRAAAGDQWTRRVADARDPACPGDARRPGHSVHSCVC
ncbi:MAG: MFS transporter [Actinomycetota bacterium]|nr:MFS transporter [Actinomycetota bacterium]